MKLRVGPYTYRVVIATPDDPAQPAEFDWWTKRFRINPRTPADCREEALRHEFVHAWRYHFGKPASDEDDANSTAAMAKMFDEQFTRAGGAWALANLDADGVISHGSAPETVGMSYAVQCGGCGSPYAQGSVVRGRPEFDPAHGRLVLRSGLYCEHCNATQFWTEAATSTGRPSGLVIDGPRRQPGDRTATLTPAAVSSADPAGPSAADS